MVVVVNGRRSRSAPPGRCSESPTGSRHQSPTSTTRKALSPSPRAWLDTRQLPEGNDEPLEITMYDMDDVERMQRRRKEEAEVDTIKT